MQPNEPDQGSNPAHPHQPEPSHSPDAQSAYTPPSSIPQNQGQQPRIPHTPDRGMSNLSHVGKKYFHLIEFDDDEELLAEIRKHPFGLFIILASGLFIALTVFAATVAFASSSFLESVGFGGTSNSVVVFVGFIFAVIVAVGTLIFAELYRNNVVYVTNEKIAQILYITLFNRKISQLNIGDVQDVTVSQRGIFQHLFNFGTLVVETAGEQQNYTFTYTPKPYETSKTIIMAHENNVKLYGN